MIIDFIEQDREAEEKFNKLSESEQNEILAGENKYNLNGGEL